MYRMPPQSCDPSPDVEDNTNIAKNQRGSRRLQGLPPEHGLLRETTRKIVAKSTAMAAPASPLCCSSPGSHQPSVDHRLKTETWLETYERIATFNNLDSDEELRHVYFALENSARTWFENQESTLTTWDLFCSGFLRTFTSVVRKERAEAMLEARAQLPNETIVIFTKEMMRLFHHADTMPEEKKIRFLVRGVMQELFAGLILNRPKTVAKFISKDNYSEGSRYADKAM
ncbi:uncharacterized protein [Dermacentor andersoni]|uniref:uncharacterized protein isoform X2 n=1 Tax=Dermacentor andersoni TaxID=34620 RepID=UPI003B3AB7E4